MNKTKFTQLKSLFASLFKIGCIGFGGGSALIPVIEEEVVEEKHLVSEDDYNKDVVVACITPGALPVEISTGLGKRIGGLSGMIGAATAIAFPGVFFTLLILSLLAFIGDTFFTQIQFISIGLGSFICCLLIVYIANSLRTAASKGRRNLINTILIMLGVFVLICGNNLFDLFSIDAEPVFNLSTLNVLYIAFFWILFTHCKFTWSRTPIATVLIATYLLCVGHIQIITSELVKDIILLIMLILSVWGLYLSIVKSPSGQRIRSSKITTLKMTIGEIIAWGIFLFVLCLPAILTMPSIVTYISNGFASSVASFGGGDAYITIADGIFVHAGSITNSQFYNYLVPIANILPGSILCKMLSGVGYFIGYNRTGSILIALIVALAGFAVSIAASGIIFCAVYFVYDNFEKVEVFQMISRWIRPIISGLLLNVLLSMFISNITAAEDTYLSISVVTVITLFITAIDLYLVFRKHKNSLILIVISAAAGLILCNLSV